MIRPDGQTRNGCMQTRSGCMQASKHGLACNEIPWQAMRWQQNDSKHARVGNMACTNVACSYRLKCNTCLYCNAS